MAPDQYCKDKAAGRGSNLSYGFRFLPKTRRCAITALYAFCREVDDVVDECHDSNVARAKLDWWYDQVTKLYQGRSEHPVMQALEPHLRTFGLRQREFEEIIDGMAMDLTTERYRRFHDLLLYCHRVAGVVGQLAARIFGYQDEMTLEYAHELGIAFQLTNIIRDVGEDVRRDRIYLPMEDFQRFNCPVIDVLNYKESEAFKALMEFQIERAQQYYRQAWAILPSQDRKSQLPGLIMAAIYRAILKEIRENGPTKVLNQRLSLPPSYKFWLVWKTWTFGYSP